MTTHQPAAHWDGVHQAGGMTWGYRPRLLDLFAGAQGAAVGYARAGFEVHAVDIEEHDKHPEVEAFTTADAFEVLADVEFCRSFDVIAASPPCRDHTRLASQHGKTGSGWMLPTTLLWLREIRRPWVIENVDTARHLRGELQLCGSMFALAADCLDGVRRYLQRHRRFASSEFLVPPGPCQHRGQAVGVYGHGGHVPQQKGYAAVKAEAQQAMAINWMRMGDLSQAIPPAYTQWIGEQLLDRLALDLAPDDAASVAPALKEAR